MPSKTAAGCMLGMLHACCVRGRSRVVVIVTPPVTCVVCDMPWLRCGLCENAGVSAETVGGGLAMATGAARKARSFRAGSGMLKGSVDGAAT